MTTGMREASPFSLGQKSSDILDDDLAITPNGMSESVFEFGTNDCESIFRCHVNEVGRPRHSNALRSIAICMAWLLFAKVFLSILYQYRWYFPADFASDFLSIRRGSFHGL